MLANLHSCDLGEHSIGRLTKPSVSNWTVKYLQALRLDRSRKRSPLLFVARDVTNQGTCRELTLCNRHKHNGNQVATFFSSQLVSFDAFCERESVCGLSLSAKSALPCRIDSLNVGTMPRPHFELIWLFAHNCLVSQAVQRVSRSATFRDLALQHWSFLRL